MIGLLSPHECGCSSSTAVSLLPFIPPIVFTKSGSLRLSQLRGRGRRPQDSYFWRMTNTHSHWVDIRVANSPKHMKMTDPEKTSTDPGRTCEFLTLMSQPVFKLHLFIQPHIHVDIFLVRKCMLLFSVLIQRYYVNELAMPLLSGSWICWIFLQKYHNLFAIVVTGIAPFHRVIQRSQFFRSS